MLRVAELLFTEGVRPSRLVTPMSRGSELETRPTMTTTNRLPRIPRWLLSASLALGAAFLSPGVAHAQDYGAIERRLAAAVQAGEITQAQAEAMLAALKRTAEERARPADAEMRAKRMRYAEYQKSLDVAVAKGELTADEAAARLAEARRAMFGGEAESKGDADPRAMRERYAQLEKRIADAVKSGRITEEQGAERLAQAMERMKGASRAKDTGDGPADMRALRMRYAEYEKGIRASVAKGELSAEDAEAKLRLAREKMFGGDKTRKTGPEAEKKDASRERKAKDGARGKRADEAAMKARYAEYEKRLEAAVARGEMTAKEAEARLAEARKDMFGE
ncbi:MAG: hypothetical protein VXZ39_02050 [Planctomycetota bacterium]|nr:hypothetical protein [Planctomycetota bacterium]